MMEGLPLIYALETARGVPFWRRKSVYLMGILILFVCGLIVASWFGYVPRTN